MSLGEMMRTFEKMQHRFTGSMEYRFQVNGYTLRVNQSGDCGSIARDGNGPFNVTDYYCAWCAADRDDGRNGNDDGTGPCEHKELLAQAQRAVEVM